MHAHTWDLRAEVQDEELAAAVRDDYRSAKLDSATRALLEYADKLTRVPASVTPDDLNRLRAEGFSDRAIHDAAQIAAYFNYINRIADGLGVDLEPEMPPHPQHGDP